MSSSTALHGMRAKRTRQMRSQLITNLLHPHTTKRIKRLFYIYLACILGSTLAAGILVANQKTTRLPDPFSVQQRAAVAFTLYYPATLPAPYYIDEASLGRLEDAVVAMRITDGTGKGNAFTLSQQRLVETTNLEALYSSFSGRQTFKSALGQATTGTIDDNKTRIVSLVTDDKTWIFVQAPAALPLTTLQQSLRDLTPSR